VVNICHLLSFYFLELLQIFVEFNTSVLPTLIKIYICVIVHDFDFEAMQLYSARIAVNNIASLHLDDLSSDERAQSWVRRTNCSGDSLSVTVNNM
jgi:hypothetical protein